MRTCTRKRIYLASGIYYSRCVKVFLSKASYVGYRCQPDNATMSLAVRPFCWKREISLPRSSKKAGSSVMAKAGLAVVESLLPSFTAQDGPPTCHIF
jgi:hypothetical protein